MLLGAALWKVRESFYNGLTLAKDGIAVEQDFAARPDLACRFPRYEEFWKRHVCPATTRPHGADFRAGIADIICLIAQTSYSILSNLVDATDSLAQVQAGDLGRNCRNCRDVLVAAGNALQLMTELQFAVCDRQAHAPTPASLAGRVGAILDAFHDWNAHWAADRDLASRYRNHLVHQGLFYTVRNQATGQTLVLGRTAFARGVRVTWNQAQASYSANPDQWLPLDTVCEEIFEETVAFIDLSYERLLAKMDGLLTSPVYQRLWGWRAGPPTAALPALRSVPSAAVGGISMHATTASMTIQTFPSTSISSGPCIP